ncbi:TadE family protein [Alkalibacillus silvisoli]|uniref:Pilus assembly protein n=1 Tax=Alkalibacillus silvisoli TaxID=392823 RepID=A0ABP3JW29_9BACI
MNKRLKLINNEKGSFSLEFLGILPLFFMLFLILWQVVASGYAIYTLKLAANEGAKNYAITRDLSESEQIMIDVIGDTTVLSYEDMSINNHYNGRFELSLEVNHFLVFVPTDWRPSTSIKLEEKTTGQVLLE